MVIVRIAVRNTYCIRMIYVCIRIAYVLVVRITFKSVLVAGIAACAEISCKVRAPYNQTSKYCAEHSRLE